MWLGTLKYLQFSFFFLRGKYRLFVKRSCLCLMFVGIKIQDVLFELFLGAIAYRLRCRISNAGPHSQKQWITPYSRLFSTS